MRSKIFKLGLAIIIGTVLGLSSHIIILKMTTPMIAHLYAGYAFPEPGQYSLGIKIFAYITALEQVAVVTFVYYFVADLIKIKNTLIKIMLLSGILLELNGNLIRLIFMNALVAYKSGVNHFILAACLSQLDQWVATILLVSALVLICPFKKYTHAFS